jgi:hypothetical protein
MTPHIAVLLATLIQPNDPSQGYALLRSQASMGGFSDPGIAGSNSVVSGFAAVAHPSIVFSFPNRHDYVMFRSSDTLTSDDIRDFSHLVRCYRTNKERSIAPRLIEIVLAAAEHFDVDSVEIISGYRARPYGAPHSKHFLGQALDIRLAGIPSARVAAWIWATFHNVGVGYYPRQNFVHVDTRDSDIRWVEQSRHGESGIAHYFTRTAREMTASAQVAASPSAHYAMASKPATDSRWHRCPGPGLCSRR